MDGYYGVLCEYCMDVFLGQIYRDSQNLVHCQKCHDVLVATLEDRHQTKEDILRTEQEVARQLRKR